MTRNLVKEIVTKTGLKESGLRVTLSRTKNRHDLTSIQQAACYYIKRKKLTINVSSIMDDVTREAVRNTLAKPPPRAVKSVPASKKTPKPFKGPKIKWLSARHYTVASQLADFYPYLFVFENALRHKIDAAMTKNHGASWWDTRVKADLSDVHRYAQDEQVKLSKLPIVGKTLTLTSLQCVTLGHLEQIIQKYNALFVPSVFPTLHFFTGHMVIIKQVRNAIAHVSPAPTLKDVRNAKNEIDILLQHLASL